MTKPIVIVGTGAFGEVAQAYFTEYKVRDVVAFSASSDRISNQQVLGRSVVALEDLQRTLPPSEIDVFVAIGYRHMNRNREQVFRNLASKGYEFATFVHPNVKIWSSSTIGRNCFIFEDNTVQPFTQIGDDTVLWSGNHIGHHSSIGDHSFISSHVVVSGSCRVGNNVFIGVNASIHDGVTVGDHALIGAGAVIARDVEPKAIYSPPRTKPRDVTTDEIDF